MRKDLNCEKTCDKINKIVSNVKYDENWKLSEEECSRAIGEIDRLIQDAKAEKEELENNEMVKRYIEACKIVECGNKRSKYIKSNLKGEI